jgi:hypothetical protein
MTMKRNLFLVLIVCFFVSFVSSAFAASVLKRVGANPFYRPPLTSEAELKEMVKSQNSIIKTGFAKAGYPNLYQAFSQQFPSSTIDSIKVSPGETFKWMFFRKKGTGPVIVTKDVTWGGTGSLDAYRFYIDMKGNRYEFAVLHACGNFALKNIAKIPAAKPPATSGKAATVAPAAKPSTSDKATAAPVESLPATSGKAAAAASAPAPEAAGIGKVDSASQMSGTSADSGATGPAAPTSGSSGSGAAGSTAPMAATAVDSAPASTTALMPGSSGSGAAGSTAPIAGTVADSAATGNTAKFLSGTVVDTGFSYQDDPASYLFVRMGYEFPLFDRLSLIAYLGGYFRIHGYEGGSAVVADAMLDYHWWNRLSFGMGAGYWWTGNDGQVDLIANVGVLVYGKPDSFNSTLFLEARSEINELDNLHNLGRFGLGIRFRF